MLISRQNAFPLIVVTVAFSLAALAGSSQAPSQASAASGPASNAKSPPKTGARKIPCKTPENASSCYWTRGRLSVYNGNPSLRIWRIGTRRILGVFNGPSHFPPRDIADDENPELPANLEQAYLADRRRWEREGTSDHDFPDIFADFEVCLLEPEKQGRMQAACIESSKNIFVQQGWR